MKLHILPGGRIRMIHSDQLCLATLSNAPIVARRASHVEPITVGPQRGRWHVDFSPLGEGYAYCLLRTFPGNQRQAALAAEVAHLEQHWVLHHE